MSTRVRCTSQTRQSTCNTRHAAPLERVCVEGIPPMNCSLSLMCKCDGHRNGHAPGTTRLKKAGVSGEKEVNLWTGYICLWPRRHRPARIRRFLDGLSATLTLGFLLGCP